MFKRILAVLMCLAMCFTFAGCSDNDEDKLIQLSDVQTSSSNPKMTISLYMPCENATPEAITEVEKALNAISIKKFNTVIDLQVYPVEEYVQIVYMQAQTSMASYLRYLFDNDEEQYYLDEDKGTDTSFPGVKLPEDINKYPDLASASFDIFLCLVPEADSPVFDPESPYYNEKGASNMLLNMYEAHVLSPLDPYLVNDYAILKSKSYTEFFSAVTYPDWMAADADKAKRYAYAMPNNYVMGEYEFLIINKDAVSSAWTQDYLKLGDSKALETLKTQLKDLKKNGDESLANIDQVFIEFDSYEDYMASEDTFALAMVKGNLGVPEVIANPNYEIIQYSISDYDSTEYRESMFCITRCYNPNAYDGLDASIDEGKRIQRCLDVLLLIQNDVEFRNTLQYGVKGTHYSEGRDGTVYAASNDYVMNPKYTGNMFILSPSDRMSIPLQKLAENNWNLAKKQNVQIMAQKPESQ